MEEAKDPNEPAVKVEPKPDFLKEHRACGKPSCEGYELPS